MISSVGFNRRIPLREVRMASLAFSLLFICSPIRVWFFIIPQHASHALVCFCFISLKITKQDKLSHIYLLLRYLFTCRSVHLFNYHEVKIVLPSILSDTLTAHICDTNSPILLDRKWPLKSHTIRSSEMSTPMRNHALLRSGS